MIINFSHNKVFFILFQHVALLGIARRKLAAFLSTTGLSFPRRCSQEVIDIRNEPGSGRDMGDFLPHRLIFMTNNLRFHSWDVHLVSIMDLQYSKNL